MPMEAWPYIWQSKVKWVRAPSSIQWSLSRVQRAGKHYQQWQTCTMLTRIQSPAYKAVCIMPRPVLAKLRSYGAGCTCGWQCKTQLSSLLWVRVYTRLKVWTAGTCKFCHSFAVLLSVLLFSAASKCQANWIWRPSRSFGVATTCP